MLQDIYLQGISASPGVAIGAAYVIDRNRISAVERSIGAGEVEEECRLFREAVSRSRQQLEEVKNRVAEPRLAEHLHIIDTHLLILDDQMLVDDTIDTIKKERINAEGALKRIWANSGLYSTVSRTNTCGSAGLISTPWAIVFCAI
jgi:phosphoenolpyruvate-protein phosphotransferase (PTS system enzyme I)